MRAGSPGFSLVEVLVTVAIVGTALTALLGILRSQVQSLRVLRHHTEARVLLERAVERFQIGDGAESDTTIQGRYGTYALSFDDSVPELESESPLAADPCLIRRRVSIQWSEEEQKRRLELYAWRYEPEDLHAPVKHAEGSSRSYLP